MVEGIAISVAGLQNASAKADKAARAIADPANYASGVEDVVDIGSGPDAQQAAVAAGASQGTLESSVVALKTAALLYKANAEALSIQLEAQKEAFEELI